MTLNETLLFAQGNSQVFAECWLVPEYALVQFTLVKSTALMFVMQQAFAGFAGLTILYLVA